jgi:hypothetical protein
MNSAQVSEPYLEAMGAGQLAATDTPMIGLFTGAPSLSKDTLLATLTALAPAFTGYAEKALTAGVARRNANGDQIQPYTHAGFIPTDAVGLPITVTGYYVQVQVGAADTLWIAEMLPTPFVFTDQFSALNLVLEMLIRNSPVWGGEVAQY